MSPAGRREFTITQVRRSEDGHWLANVTPASGAEGIEVNRQFGSWQVPVNGDGRRRDVLPHIAAALQERVRPLERREQRLTPTQS